MLSYLLPEVPTKSKFTVTQQNYHVCTPHLSGVMLLDSRLRRSNSKMTIVLYTQLRSITGAMPLTYSAHCLVTISVECENEDKNECSSL